MLVSALTKPGINSRSSLLSSLRKTSFPNLVRHSSPYLRGLYNARACCETLMCYRAASFVSISRQRFWL